MKTIKKIIFVILLYASYNVAAIAQNLNSMPVVKRDSILISIAKEAVLKCGPDYYREYKEPVIREDKVPPEGKDAGKIIFWVTFLYDRTEETLEWDYAAQVNIWGDTGRPIAVFFGNGFGRRIPDNIDWRKDTTIAPMPYQESIRPIYNINNPDPNQEPVNKDVLIRKGFEKRSDGEWVRTRPDTPPAEALKVIERAKEEIRQAKDNIK